MCMCGQLRPCTCLADFFYLVLAEFENPDHNAIKDEITVENGIVKHNENIMIYLGTGAEPEDQIVYDHGKFHLKNQAKGNAPVLRITYHGAEEYAAHFGKELLTEKEWRFAYQYHMNSVNSEIVTEEIKVNKIGTLNDMGDIIKEWVQTPDQEKIDIPVTELRSISGVMDSQKAKNNDKAALRHKWEGFSYVGFRTKIPVL